MKDMPESLMSEKLISRRLFFVSALIGGPMIAGFVAAHNFWNRRMKARAFQMILWGFLLTLLFEALLALIIIYFLRPLHISSGVFVTVLLAGGGQLIFAFLILQLLKIRNLGDKIFPDKATYYGKWQILPIVFLSFTYLLVHMSKPILFAHFPNMILLFYLLPHFYFYNKLKHIFSIRKMLISARWIIGAMACYLPLVFVLSDILPKEIMNFPMFIAECSIYTLLYLFLLVYSLNLLAKLTRKLKVLPLNYLEHPVTKSISLIFVLIVLLIILYKGHIRYNNIIVNTYNIEVKARDAVIDSLKVCFVADMHLNDHTSSDFLKEYVKQVTIINPDIILYGGDMVESRSISKEKMAIFDKQLNSLKAPYGKFMVFGNHDRSKYNGYDKETGITYLSDTLVEVANSFYLMGLRYRTSEKKPIAKLKSLAKKNLPVFLLDHAPYQLKEASKNNIDIQFSGHTHYGQVWPINYIIDLLYENPWGYEKISNTHFFVTSGIQGWGTPIRTAGQSEIMVINVAFID